MIKDKKTYIVEKFSSKLINILCQIQSLITWFLDLLFLYQTLYTLNNKVEENHFK